MQVLEVRVADRDAHLVPVEASASAVVRGTTAGVAAVLEGRLRRLLSSRSLASSVLDREGLEVALRAEVLAACPWVVAVTLVSVEDPTGFLDHAAAVAHAQESAAARSGVARVLAASAEGESLAVQRAWAAWKDARLAEITAVAEVDAAAARAAHAAELAAVEPMGDHGRVAAWRRGRRPARRTPASGSPTARWSTSRPACPTPTPHR